MWSRYPACFIKESNGYSVIFPDLGVATCGSTFEEANYMAMDCLAGVIFNLQRDGERIPPPSPIDQIDPFKVLAELSDKGEFNNCETFLGRISVNVEAYAKNYFRKPAKKVLPLSGKHRSKNKFRHKRAMALAKGRRTTP